MSYLLRIIWEINERRRMIPTMMSTGTIGKIQKEVVAVIDALCAASVSSIVAE
mgnify:CR=1 FL=1